MSSKSQKKSYQETSGEVKITDAASMLQIIKFLRFNFIYNPIKMMKRKQTVLLQMWPESDAVVMVMLDKLSNMEALRKTFEKFSWRRLCQRKGWKHSLRWFGIIKVKSQVPDAAFSHTNKSNLHFLSVVLTKQKLLPTCSIVLFSEHLYQLLAWHLLVDCLLLWGLYLISIVTVPFVLWSHLGAKDYNTTMG